MKRIILNTKSLAAIVLFQLISFSPAFSQFGPQVSVFQCQPTTWYGNKSAAVSLTFDDGPLCQFQVGLNLLNTFGFRGTYNVITRWIDSGLYDVTWDTVRKASFYGNEIASHTVNHADLSSLTKTPALLDSLQMELEHSKQRIEAEIPNQNCLTLAYPWTKYNDTVRIATSQYYISARTAGFPESKTPYNFFSLAGTVIWTNTSSNDLNFYLNYCISRGDWFIEMIHGIDQGGWQPVPRATYYNHFSYLKARENWVWVAPQQEVVKYIKERQSLVISNKKFVGDTLSFDVSDNLNDSIYNFPVTVKLTPPTCFLQIDSIRQNNRKVSFNTVPYSWTRDIYFNVYPDSGKVKIYGSASLLPKPIVRVLGDTSFCQGDSVILKGTDHMKKYIWNTIDSNTQFLVIKNSGKYSLTQVDQNGCYTKPSDTLNITVHPLPPKPEIVSSGSFNICTGDTTVLRTAIPYYKYKWSTGSVDSAITVKSSGIFAVRVTDINQCVSYSDTRLLSIHPIPPAPVITMVSKATLCNGDSAILFASEGYKKYLWSTGDTTQLLIIRDNKQIPYTVRVTDQYNCQSPVSKIVYVPENFSKLKPNVRLSGKETFCEGDSAVLTVIEDKYRINWNTLEASKSIIIRKSGNYSVTLVNEFNCKSEPSEPISINTLARPHIPNIYVPGNRFKLCEGDSITLSAKRGPYSYKWSTGENGSAIKVKQSGNYSLMISDNNGCKSFQSDNIHVLFTPIPVKPQIIKANLKYLECPVDAEDYFWYLDNQYIGNNSKIINPSLYGNGNYSVSISNDECMSDTSDQFYYNQTTGIQNAYISNNLILYPNPGNGLFNISFNNKTDKNSIIEIYDETAKLVYNSQIPMDKSDLKINLTDQPDGTYLLVFQSNGRKSSLKFTIKRN